MNEDAAVNPSRSPEARLSRAVHPSNVDSSDTLAVLLPKMLPTEVIAVQPLKVVLYVVTLLLFEKSPSDRLFRAVHPLNALSNEVIFVLAENSDDGTDSTPDDAKTSLAVVTAVRDAKMPPGTVFRLVHPLNSVEMLVTAVVDENNPSGTVSRLVHPLNSPEMLETLAAPAKALSETFFRLVQFLKRLDMLVQASHPDRMLAPTSVIPVQPENTPESDVTAESPENTPSGTDSREVQSWNTLENVVTALKSLNKPEGIFFREVHPLKTLEN